MCTRLESCWDSDGEYKRRLTTGLHPCCPINVWCYQPCYIFVCSNRVCKRAQWGILPPAVPNTLSFCSKKHSFDTVHHPNIKPCSKDSSPFIFQTKRHPSQRPTAHSYREKWCHNNIPPSTLSFVDIRDKSTTTGLKGAWFRTLKYLTSDSRGILWVWLTNKRDLDNAIVRYISDLKRCPKYIVTVPFVFRF